VDGHLEAVFGSVQEELRGPPSLVEPQEDSFARCPEGEDPVEPPGDEVLDVRRERVLVERLSALAERRDRGGERSFQHAATLSSRA
jgi:hypothetical protein